MKRAYKKEIKRFLVLSKLKRMPEKLLSDLGEWKIIELFKKFSYRSRYLEEYDDAWCLRVNGRYFTFSSDMLVYSTDVPCSMTLEQVGRKAIISSASDIASKGHEPAYFLVALGLPKEMKESEIRKIAKGIKRGIEEVGGKLVAGDTNESKELVISVSVIGYGKFPPVRRTLGNEGNIIATVGEFGNSAAGLMAVLNNLKLPRKLSRSLLKAVNEPRALVKEGILLGRKGILAGSTDSSDGLAVSLYNMAKNSKNLGVLIEHLPASKEAEEFARLFNFNLEDLVLYGGEEYNLVISVKKGKESLLGDEINDTRVIRIGKVINKRGIWLKKEGKIIKVENKGWEHFKSS